MPLRVRDIPFGVVLDHVAACLDVYDAAVLLRHVCALWRRQHAACAAATRSEPPDYAQLFRDVTLGGGGGCRFQAANLRRALRGEALHTMRKPMNEVVVGCHTSNTHALVFCESGRLVCFDARWRRGGGDPRGCRVASYPGAVYYYVAGHICLGQRLLSVELCDDGRTMLCGFCKGLAAVDVHNVLQPSDVWHSNEGGPLRGHATSCDAREVYTWGARRGGVRSGLWRFDKDTLEHTYVALDVQCAVAVRGAGVVFAQARKLTAHASGASCRLPFVPSSMQRAGGGRILVRRQDGFGGGPSAVVHVPSMRVERTCCGPHTSVIGAARRVVSAPLRLYGGGAAADAALVGALPGGRIVDVL